MIDDSKCSAETKSADEETWLDETPSSSSASSQPPPRNTIDDPTRHIPVVSTKKKLEPSGLTFSELKKKPISKDSSHQSGATAKEAWLNETPSPPSSSKQPQPPPRSTLDGLASHSLAVLTKKLELLDLSSSQKKKKNKNPNGNGSSRQSSTFDKETWLDDIPSSSSQPQTTVDSTSPRPILSIKNLELSGLSSPQEKKEKKPINNDSPLQPSNDEETWLHETPSASSSQPPPNSVDSTSHRPVLSIKNLESSGLSPPREKKKEKKPIRNDSSQQTSKDEETWLNETPSASSSQPPPSTVDTTRHSTAVSNENLESLGVSYSQEKTEKPNSNRSSQQSSTEDDAGLDETPSSSISSSQPSLSTPDPIRHSPVIVKKKLESLGLSSSLKKKKKPISNGSSQRSSTSTDGSSRFNLLRASLGNPPLRRPWKPSTPPAAVAAKTTTKKLVNAIANGSLDPRNGHVRRNPKIFGTGSGSSITDPTSQNSTKNNGPSFQKRIQKATKTPDMALLKRLKGDRERDTNNGSLDLAQKVVRHVPRKLRRNINQHSGGSLSAVEEHKSVDPSDPTRLPQDNAEPTPRVLPAHDWESFYVGSISLPDRASPSAVVVPADGGSPSNQGRQTQEKKKQVHNSSIKMGLAAISSKLDPKLLKSSASSSSSSRRKVQKGLPSLFEKSYDFSPVGLRNYELGSQQNISCELGSVSFLNHLRFLSDGQVELPPTCDPLFRKDGTTTKSPSKKDETKQKPKTKNGESRQDRNQEEKSPRCKSKKAKSASASEPSATEKTAKGGIKSSKARKSHHSLLQENQKPKISGSRLSRDNPKVETEAAKTPPRNLVVWLSHTVQPSIIPLDNDNRQQVQRPIIIMVGLVFVVAAFALIGRGRQDPWQGFFDKTQEQSTTIARFQNPIPTLGSDFYSKSSATTTHTVSWLRKARTVTLESDADDDGDTIQTPSNTMHSTQGLSSSSSSSSSSSTVHHVLHHVHPPVDILSASRPFVATRSSKPLPDVADHEVGASSSARMTTTQKIVGPIFLPFVVLYRLGQKILRSIFNAGA